MDCNDFSEFVSPGIVVVIFVHLILKVVYIFGRGFLYFMLRLVSDDMDTVLSEMIGGDRLGV